MSPLASCTTLEWAATVVERTSIAIARYVNARADRRTITLPPWPRSVETYGLSRSPSTGMRRVTIRESTQSVRAGYVVRRPPADLRARLEPELLANPSHVALRCSLGDGQPRADLLVRKALGNEFRDGELTSAERAGSMLVQCARESVGNGEPSAFTAQGSSPRSELRLEVGEPRAVGQREPGSRPDSRLVEYSIREPGETQRPVTITIQRCEVREELDRPDKESGGRCVILGSTYHVDGLAETGFRAFDVARLKRDVGPGLQSVDAQRARRSGVAIPC